MIRNNTPDDSFNDNMLEERKKAELEFVTAAYLPEEAWVCYEKNEIHRILRLPLLKESDFVTVEIILTMPSRYPTESIINVDGIVCNSNSDMNHGRKIAFEYLPKLLQVCRETASEYAGEESVFVILNSANEWVETEWLHFLSTSSHYKNKGLGNNSYNNITEISTNHNDSRNQQPSPSILGRRLIYSHHIIAKTKRKAIADLAGELHLGGYVKIGWPGIIMIEGLEENCIEFVNEMKSMRWQYLVVRGEEQINLQSQNSCIDDYRKFHKKFQELGEDEMSTLASICKTVGMEDLFLTGMKIYKKDDHESTSDEVSNEYCEDDISSQSSVDYSALIHIDHMNDPKGYEKWLQKACKNAGCSMFLRRYYFCNNNDESTCQRPLILVGLWGMANDVKKILKRWRTSRVDVDSKGKPCLERMMTVLVENDAYEGIVPYSNDVYNDDDNTLEGVLTICKLIGGEAWESAVMNLIQNKALLQTTAQKL